MPPTLAARWMTTCESRRASKQASRSRRSCSAERIVLTRAPRSSSIATVGRPRKPAPPVTATALPSQNPGSALTEAIARKASGRLCPFSGQCRARATPSLQPAPAQNCGAGQDQSHPACDQQRDQRRSGTTRRRGLLRTGRGLLPDNALAASHHSPQLLLSTQAELGGEDHALAGLERLDRHPARPLLPLDAQLPRLGRLAPGGQSLRVEPLGDERELNGGQRRL